MSFELHLSFRQEASLLLLAYWVDHISVHSARNWVVEPLEWWWGPIRTEQGGEGAFVTWTCLPHCVLRPSLTQPQFTQLATCYSSEVLASLSHTPEKPRSANRLASKGK